MVTSSKSEPTSGAALHILPSIWGRQRPGTLTHINIRHIQALQYVSAFLYEVHTRQTRSMTDDTRSPRIF